MLPEHQSQRCEDTRFEGNRNYGLKIGNMQVFEVLGTSSSGLSWPGRLTVGKLPKGNCDVRWKLSGLIKIDKPVERVQDLLSGNGIEKNLLSHH